MSAMEKVAWTELLVSVAAVALATILYPWLEDAALGVFGLLFLPAFVGMWFLWPRDASVLVDERDDEIDRRARQAGIGTAWTILLLALTVIVFWSELSDEETVATDLLGWLLMINVAICAGMEELIGVLLYRRQRRAA